MSPSSPRCSGATDVAQLHGIPFTGAPPHEMQSHQCLRVLQCNRPVILSHLWIDFCTSPPKYTPTLLYPFLILPGIASLAYTLAKFSFLLQDPVLVTPSHLRFHQESLHTTQIINYSIITFCYWY